MADKEGVNDVADNSWQNAASIYEFQAKDIDSNDVTLDKYKGNVVLVVNVASNCGFTKTNYKELNELHDKYSEAGLKILAFPCNQFAGQEPGCDIDIKEFINKNNVKFDVFSKINVNGNDAHPLYKFLKTKQHGFLLDGIKWNFTKFLVDKDGQPIKRYAPTTSPLKLENDIVAVM